jgi:hypothetical protein
MLGPPHGGSPACNRAVTATGSFDLLVPPGQYYAYATIGPFSTIYRQLITVGAGEEEDLTMQVQSLASGLLPPDVVSGDFHVHGAASYDSSIPDQDRVSSFLAAGVDVIVASDHDVVTTYQDTLSALGATKLMTVIPGVEQTPNILWFAVPGQEFPKTLGHFNFWPLDQDTSLPRNGAPWDELREPGQMMDDIEPVFSGAGVRQLNHPYSLTKLGRDQGFLRAIGYDPTKPIAPGAGFAADLLLHAPGGGHRNIDWDVEEVMTGASRRDWLRYRKLWFSLLSQGFLRAGAANSDTHTLALEQVGYPRNLIWSPNQSLPSKFNIETFDADVRAGHMAGTNGPVLAVTIDDDVKAGPFHRPGIAPGDVVSPVHGAVLDISVQAAPWIPFTEVRVFVNGHLVRITQPFKQTQNPDPYVVMKDTFDPTDHFGTVLRTAHIQIPLSVLTASVASADAWLIVEAGYPAWSGQSLDAPDPPDTDGDGLPDLDDADIPVRPPMASDAYFDLAAIAPGVWPTAFSNPFLLDLDGGGWQAPGL